MRRFIITSSLIAISACVGMIIGYQYSEKKAGADSSMQVRLGEGRLTNPLLECEIADGTINAEKVNFKPEIEKLAKELKSSGSITDVAIYFRDLNNGPTFGIGQDEAFVPASLIKVPIMMAFYKVAEFDPSILTRKLKATDREASFVGAQQVKPEQTIVIGQEYTVEELIEKMIVYSDNASTILATTILPKEALVHLYSLLGVEEQTLSNPAATLTVKQYAAFFRILFNASFLSQASSEKALGLLARSKFKNSLAAGTPRDTLVANKFGERRIGTQDQLHDCGIIYYPKHPYLLCVMTRGNDISRLQTAIKQISKMTYDKIDEQYR